MLIRTEIERLLAAMSGTPALVARLLYGTGMRRMECLRLRVKDLDFDRRVIIVREGKGQKERRTVLPAALVPAASEQVQFACALWRGDRAAERPSVAIPAGLARTYPRAEASGAWSTP